MATMMKTPTIRELGKALAQEKVGPKLHAPESDTSRVQKAQLLRAMAEGRTLRIEAKGDIQPIVGKIIDFDRFTILMELPESTERILVFKQVIASIAGF